MTTRFFKRNSKVRLVPVLIATLLASATICSAGQPTTYAISEIFSTPDGKYQFIELQEFSNDNGRSEFTGHELRSKDNIYEFPADLPSGWTAQDAVLIATQGVADLLAKQPDPIAPNFIIPDGFFNPNGDTISLPVSNTERSFEQGELPLNGFESLVINSRPSDPLLPGPASPTAHFPRSVWVGVPKRIVAPSSARPEPTPGVAYFDTHTDTIMFAGNTMLETTGTMEAVFALKSDAVGHLFFEQATGERKRLMVGEMIAGGDAIAPPDHVNAFIHRDAVIEKDVFHHIAFVRDEREERIYLDGRLLESRPASGEIGNIDQEAFTPFQPVPYPGAIGASQYQGSTTRANAMVGFIDSIRISDVARYSGSRIDPPSGDMTNDEATRLLFNFNLDEIGHRTVLDLAGVNAHPGYIGVSPKGVGISYQGTEPEILPLSDLNNIHPIEGLFATGVNSNRYVVASDTVDSHYTLDGKDATVRADSPNRVNSRWARWIDFGDPGDVPAGAYEFETSFELPGDASPTSIRLSMTVAGDERVSILVNGQETELKTTRRDRLTTFAISGEQYPFFRPGRNTLTFRVENDAGITGLLVHELKGSYEISDLRSFPAKSESLVVNLDAQRYGNVPGRAANQLEVVLPGPAHYRVSLVSAAEDTEALFTAWHPGGENGWVTGVQMDAAGEDKSLGASGAGYASAKQAYDATFPPSERNDRVISVPSDGLTAKLWVEDATGSDDNRGGVSLRFEKTDPRALVVWLDALQYSRSDIIEHPLVGNVRVSTRLNSPSINVDAREDATIGDYAWSTMPFFSFSRNQAVRGSVTFEFLDGELDQSKFMLVASSNGIPGGTGNALTVDGFPELLGFPGYQTVDVAEPVSETVDRGRRLRLSNSGRTRTRPELLGFGARNLKAITVDLDSSSGADFALGVVPRSAPAAPSSPVLVQGVSVELDAMAEDDSDSPGTTVSDLVAKLGAAAVDPNRDPLGIGIIGVAEKFGTWQVSLDGRNWQAVGDVSESAALLIPPTGRVRLVPVADFSGTIETALRFTLWDQTQGSAGETHDVTRRGGGSAFSAGTAGASLQVTPGNDPPQVVATPDPVNLAVAGTGATVRMAGFFEDDDSAGLVYSIAAVSNSRVLASANIEPGTGVLTLLPAPGESGVTNVTVRCADRGGLFAEVQVPVQVAAANTTPRALPTGDVTLASDAAPAVLDMGAWFEDAEDSDRELTYKVIKNSHPQVFVQIASNASQLTLLPTPKTYATARLTIVATDSGGLFATNSLYIHIRTTEKPEALPPVKTDSRGRPDIVLNPKTSPRPPKPTPDDPDDTGEIKFEFESDPGREYCLERAEDLEGPWEKITAVVASEKMTSISDLIPEGKEELFWRLCVEDDSANDPLEVEDFEVSSYNANGEIGALMRVVASSGAGVADVNIYDGSKLLGAAEQSGNDDEWTFRLPLAGLPPAIFELRAEVIDHKGDTEVTSMQRVFLADPLKFIPYDPATGEEMLAGSFVEIREGKLLRPFKYRQAGGADPLNTLCFIFPEGAWVGFADGEGFIEFTRATAYFNEDDSEPFEKTSSSFAKLPLGEIPQERFARIFDLDPQLGVEFDLWGLVPIVWTGGAIGENGLRGATLRLPSSILPLPPNHLAEATEYTETESGVALVLRYYGAFTLGEGATVIVSPRNPMTLRIEPDGSFALSAPVHVSFQNGASFKGWLSFADPFYQFTFRATGITIPLLSSLSGSLPDDPEACIAQANPTNAELAQAALCLRAYQRSYRAFGATASAEIADSAADTAALFVSAAKPTVTSLINAWGFRMAAGGAAVLDAAETSTLGKLLDQTGDSAVASGDLPLISEHTLALIRAQIGLELALMNGAGSDELNELVQRVGEAIEKANRAAIAAAESPEVLSSVGSLGVLLENLAGMQLQVMEAQEKGLTIEMEPQFLTAMKTAIERTLVNRVFSLGVVPNVYQAPPGSPIEGMNRFLLQKHVKEFVTIYSQIALIQQFDISIAEFPFFEAANQLMLQQEQLLLAAAANAVQRKNFRGVQSLIREMLKLGADAAVLGLDDSPRPITVLAEVPNVLQQLQETGILDSENEDFHFAINEVLLEIQRTTLLLSELPENDAGFAQIPYASLVGTLGEVFKSGGFPVNPGTGETYTAHELNTLLEGILVHDRVLRRVRNGGGRTFVSDATASPFCRTIELLIEQAGGAADGNAGPALMWPLDTAVEVLLREASEISSEAVNPALDASKREERRVQHKLYLDKVARLLSAYRVVATRLWESAADQSGSIAGLVDMFLPGDVIIRDVAGCATYHRGSQYFRGCFQGKVEIPSTESFFVVKNASFDSRFNFALAAYGDIRIPKEPGKQVRVRVPERQPVVLEWNEATGLEVSGRAKLELPGGYFVGGYWNVDPPQYAFGMEAGGLKVDLLDSIGGTYPTINEQKLGTLNTAAQIEIGNYLTAMGNEWAKMVADVESAEVDSVPKVGSEAYGTPPEFAEPLPDQPYTEFSGWVESTSPTVVSVIREEHGENAQKNAANSALDDLRISFANAISELRAGRDLIEREKTKVELLIEWKEVMSDLAVAIQREEARLEAEAQAGNPTVSEIAQFRDLIDELQIVAEDILNTVPDDDYASILIAGRFLVDAQAIRQQLSESTSVDLAPLTAKTDAAIAEFRAQQLTGTENKTFGEIRVAQRIGIKLAEQSAQLGSDDGTFILELSQLSQVAFTKATAEHDATLAMAKQIDCAALEAAPGFAPDSLIPSGYNVAAEEVLRFKIACLASERFDLVSELASFGINVDAGSHFQAVVEAHRHLRCHWKIKGRMDLNAGRVPQTYAAVEKEYRKFVASKHRQRSQELERYFALGRRLLDRNEARIQANSDAGDLLKLARAVNSQLINLTPEDYGSLEELVLDRIQSLSDTSLDDYFVNRSLGAGLLILDDLLTAAQLAQSLLDGSELDAAAQTISSQLEKLTSGFLSAADAQKAAWYVDQYFGRLTTAYGTFLVNGIAAPVMTAVTNDIRLSVETAAVVSAYFKGLYDTIDKATFTFALPGDIKVPRVYGDLAFNTVTGEWKAGFGGRVEFPEVKKADGTGGYFEVVSATIDSNSLFELSLKTGGPVPFDFGDGTVKLDIDTAFQLRGQFFPGAITGAQAMGTLTTTDAGNNDVDTFMMTMGYAYDDDTTTHNFNFYFESDQELILSKDLVVFTTGAGTDVSAQNQQFDEAKLYTNATVGIWNKSRDDRPDNWVPKREDFELIYGGTVFFALKNEDGGVRHEIGLRDGFLALPEGFKSRVCTANQGFLDELFDLPAMVLVQNITLGHSTQDGLIMNGEIGLQNISMAFEGYEQVWLDVCSASLFWDVQAGSFGFKDVDAYCGFPIGYEQHARVRVKDASWALGELPVGELILVDDVTLLDFDQFKVAMRGVVPEEEPNAGEPRSYMEIGSTPAQGDEPEANFVRLRGDFLFTVDGVFTDSLGANVPLSAGVTTDLKIGLREGTWPEVNDLEWDLSSVTIAATPTPPETKVILFLGDGVVGVVNPSLTLENPKQLFVPDFALSFSFGLRIASSTDDDAPAVTLSTTGSRLEFDGTPGSPYFIPGKSCYQYFPGTPDEQPAESDGVQQSLTGSQLPLMVEQLCINYRSANGDEQARLPLLPTDIDQLPPFDPQNLELSISASLNLPPGAPVISGKVENLMVALNENGLPVASVNAIGFGVDFAEILGEDSPLKIAGNVYIGGLQHPPNYFFSGKLEGNYKGNAFDVVVAFDCKGLRGCCFGLAGSEINIPIAYGFVLTGAKGGVVFDANTIDPCAFLADFPISPDTGRPLPGAEVQCLDDEGGGISCPLLDWETLDAMRRSNGDRDQLDDEYMLAVDKWKLKERLVQEGVLGEEADALLADMNGDEVTDFKDDLNAMEADEDPETPENYCPGLGDCPPAAVSIFCQPHPESFTEGSKYEGRTVLKFSSIPEPTLHLAGITPENIEQILLSFGVNAGITQTQLQQLAVDSAERVRAWVDQISPRIPGEVTPFMTQEAIDIANDRVQEALDALETGMIETMLNAMCLAGIDTIAVPQDVEPATYYAGLIYEAVREAAYAGIECPEMTIRLEGSFSYTGVSSFASITGGVVLSSNGNGGIVGSVNVFGVPIGQARCFVAQTDKFGNPSVPSICGEIVGKVGPLEFGSVAGLLDCPECTTKLFNAFSTLAGSLQSEYVFQIMGRLDLGDNADLLFPNKTTAEYLALLDTMDLQMAFMSTMVQNPPLTAGGDYSNEFVDFLALLADSVVPRIGVCGSIEPKLFGFPLSGDNALAKFKMYAGLKDPGSPEFLELVQFGFSPTQMMVQSAAGITGGAGQIVAGLLPAPDQATATTVITIPSLGTITRDALTRPPAEWAGERLEETLKHSLTTFDYRFAPFGLEAARAGGRIIFPSFDHHPLGPNPKQIPATWPTRAEVLTAALGDVYAETPTNFLSDPFWTGETEDFAEIFVGTDFENLTWPHDISLIDHFFPRGGVLGAGRLDLPVLLSEPINESLAPLQPFFDGNAGIGDKFTAAQTFITDKFLKTQPSGAIAFYIPAPQVPGGADFPQDFSRFADAVLSFDLEEIQANAGQQGVEEALSQFDETFLQGWLDADILGVPIVDAGIQLDIDADRIEMPVCFLVNARLDPDGWLGSYFPQQQAVGENGDAAPVFVNFDVLIEPHPAAANSKMLRLRDDIRREIEVRTLRGLDVSNVEPNAVTAAAETLQALTLDDLRTELAAAFPRVYGKIEGNLTIPFPGVADSSMFTIEEALVEAYSPLYDLDGADRSTPWGRIQKDGGIGMKGTFDVLDGFVRVDDAELVFYPDDNFAPSVQGEFVARTSSIGGLAAEGEVSVRFQSDTTDGTTLNVRGQLPELDLGQFARIYNESGGDRSNIPVDLNLEVDEGEWSDATLDIGPGVMESPFFAPGTRVVVHGTNAQGNPDISEPFSFSLTDSWGASISIEGDQALLLRVGDEIYARIEPARAGGVADFVASVTGTGAVLDSFQVDNLPGGLRLTTFPELPTTDVRRQQFTTGANATGSLLFAADGAFSVSLAVNGSFSPAITGLGDGVRYQNGFSMTVNNDGLAFDGESAPISIPVLGSIEPLPGDADGMLGLRFKATRSDGGELLIDPARLHLGTAGYGQVLDIHHPNSASEPFQITTSGNWSAAVTLQEVGLNVTPDYRLVTVGRKPKGITAAAPLFTTVLNGNGLAGAQFLFVGDAADMVVRTLPDDTSAADGGKANPLMQTFEFKAPSPEFRLSVGDPPVAGLRQPRDGHEDAEGFSFHLDAIIPAIDLSPLLEIGGDSGSVTFADGTLRCEFDNPDVSSLGVDIGSAVSSVAFDFGITGDFSAAIVNGSTVDLLTVAGFDILQMRAGTHQLNGNLQNPLGTMGLDFAGRFRYLQPVVNNNGTVGSVTRSHDFDIVFDQDVEYTFSSNDVLNLGVVDTNLGWIRVERGSAGKIKIGRESGDFYVDFLDWDIDLFPGLDLTTFNNVDLQFNTSGRMAVSLGASSFSLGAGTGRIGIATNDPMALSWNLADGTLGVTFPTSATLTLPGANLQSGILTTGLDLPQIAIGRSGSFDTGTINRAITLNGINFGSIGVRLHRGSRTGPVAFEIDSQAVSGYGSLSLNLSAASNAAFASSLNGLLQVAIGDCRPTSPPLVWCPFANHNAGQQNAALRLASTNLDLDPSKTSDQFTGDVTLTGVAKFAVKLGTNGGSVAVSEILGVGLPASPPALPFPALPQ